jgi:hypothetical protein
MFRDRRWLDLLTLIDWLPRNSAYFEAISDDEEVAEDVLSRPENKRPRGAGPRISEWSPELERLTDLVDRMGEVMVAVIASQGGKPPRLRPHPRPRTAIDRLRERKRYEHHKKTVARVIIQQADGTATPVAVQKPPARKLAKAAIAPAGTPADRPAIAPGEDPFRLKAPRSRPKTPPGGPVTGEPIKPDA